MRKLLLLLAGLLFSILPSSAQQKIADITSRVVTHSADLTSGYYILNCYSIDNTSKPNGSVLYNPSVNNGRKIQYDYNGFINNDNKTTLTDSEAAYIWYVNKEEDGRVTIRNVLNNIYFPLDAKQGDNMANPETKETARFTLTDKSGSDDADNCEGIVLKTTSPTNTSWSIVCNYLENSQNNPTLSYWESGGNGELLFNFVEVQNVDYNIAEYSFHTSAAPSNNEFNANTRWQFLTIKNKYLYYTDDDTYIQVTDNYSINDKYLWAFHINEDGKVVIYNKAAGATKVLAAGAMTTGEGNLSNGGGTYPKFVPASSVPEDQIAVWGGYKSTDISGKDGFYLYRGDNQKERMNLRTAGSTNVLAFWTQGANEGSTFWVVPYVNYTIKCVDENGTELKTVTGSGVGGTAVTLPVIDLLSPASATYNDQSLSLENNNTQITLPEDYDCEIKVTYNISSFEVSESYEKAKWYHIQMHNSKNESFMQYVNNTEIKGYPKDIYNDAQYWCFVGDFANGVKLYNKAAGEGLAVTFATTEDATMGDSNAAAAVWKIAVSDPKENITNGDKKFTLKTNTTDSGNVYLNMNGDKVLTFWDDDDDGSTMVAYSVEDELQDLVQEYEDLVSAPNIGAVGMAKKPEAIKAAIDEWKKTPSAEALSKIQNMCADTVSFAPTLYYRIENVTRKRSTKNTDKVGDGGYLEFADKLEDTAFTGGNFFANDKSSNRASAIWKFESVNTTDTYKLCNLNSKQYIMDNSVGNSVLNKSNSSEATNFKLVKLPATAQFKICNASVIANRLHVTGAEKYNGGNLIIHNGGDQNSASAWYIIPATTINVTITEARYATVNYPFAVRLPEGLIAYTASSVSEDKTKLLLKKVPNGLIPANTPVVLQGAAETYALTIVPNDPTPSIEGNLLAGTTLFEEAPNEKVFVLGKIDNEVGFYKLNDAEDANRTITANKAYLPSSNLPNTVLATRGFIFSFNDDNSGETTTGIENATVNLDEEEFYDLQGRRVMNPTKGIYVTKSGKKILFTK